MLKKKKRLSREEFNRFFLLGSRSNSKHTQLLYTAHNTQHTSVVISKKIVKLAVNRNKLRRRVFELVHRSGKNGVFIFIMKKNSGSLPYLDLKKEIEKLINKINK